jgi:hypothetical protein
MGDARATCGGKREKHKFDKKNVERKSHLENLDVECRIILIYTA